MNAWAEWFQYLAIAALAVAIGLDSLQVKP